MSVFLNPHQKDTSESGFPHFVTVFLKFKVFFPCEMSIFSNSHQKDTKSPRSDVRFSKSASKRHRIGTFQCLFATSKIKKTFRLHLHGSFLLPKA